MQGLRFKNIIMTGKNSEDNIQQFSGLKLFITQLLMTIMLPVPFGKRLYSMEGKRKNVVLTMAPYKKNDMEAAIWRAWEWITKFY